MVHHYMVNLIYEFWRLKKKDFFALLPSRYKHKSSFFFKHWQATFEVCFRVHSCSKHDVDVESVWSSSAVGRSSVFVFVLLSEAVTDREEIPASLLVELPHVRLLLRVRNGIEVGSRLKNWDGSDWSYWYHNWWHNICCGDNCSHLHFSKELGLGLW